MVLITKGISTYTENIRKKLSRLIFKAHYLRIFLRHPCLFGFS